MIRNANLCGYNSELVRWAEENGCPQPVEGEKTEESDGNDELEDGEEQSLDE